MTDRKQDIVERLRETRAVWREDKQAHQKIFRNPDGHEAAAEIERLRDKVEGLTADLHNAVQTAYNRGAHEWTRLNYPQWLAWMESQAKESQS